MIAVYQNTVLPIPKWVNIINVLPFVLVIILLAYLFMFLEHGYFWRIFIFLIFLITIFSLTMNFGFLFPRYYTLYQFSCNLNTLDEPLINFELSNFGKGISVNHIFINVSNSNYSIFNEKNPIDGNMKFILQPNENFKTFFNIKLPRNTNHTIKITNNIDCEKFYCYLLGKTPIDMECSYKCEKNKCVLIK